MGRPRLYNTSEEKKAARSAINERSYQRFVIYFVSVEKFFYIVADIEIISMSNGQRSIMSTLGNSPLKPGKSKSQNNL